ncbi:L-serine ammonia-lyase, iron-sulfur-dependent, subunit beta [Mesotoga sp. UBA5825]|jgi:L-serine dehydratase|uniref:L-serine ammonia-lyase, iron-sulfur-dependent, subunit beta n=2 Tax=unclassified Mesotoga TaxID=1184398 RepID=UPI0025CEF90E|nr:L-serine ammonia-lyase, iron-sulfur-dependent, subunit alpha [Mesotoga sp. UBA5825]
MIMKFEDLVKAAKDSRTPLDKVVSDWYMMNTGNDPKAAEETAKELVREMLGSYHSRLDRPEKSLTGWVGDNDAKARSHVPEFLSPLVFSGVSIALSMSEHNASMGKIVACPTAGACGVVPGALLSLHLNRSIDLDILGNALLVSGAVGERIRRRASISGAMSGCQAEVGTATAMASVAIVYATHPEDYSALENAPALALKSLLGLVCDPVGGFVEIPCVKRNAFGVSIAFTAAELALAGIKSAIPFEEVADSLGRVGRRLPEELKETARGGIAITPTAKKMVADFLGGEHNAS